jgi:hypothetical protein
MIGGLAAFFLLRRSVKVYKVTDESRELIAKARITAGNPRTDLTPLRERAEDGRFMLEIDRFAAKSLNGKTVEITYGPASLKHRIAYEGNIYRIEADFRAGVIRAVY